MGRKCLVTKDKCYGKWILELELNNFNISKKRKNHLLSRENIFFQMHNIQAIFNQYFMEI